MNNASGVLFTTVVLLIVNMLLLRLHGKNSVTIISMIAIVPFLVLLFNSGLFGRPGGLEFWFFPLPLFFISLCGA
ncbi:MAG: hypothetical protein ACLFQK_11740, partial [Fibrobacterota bacterium]